MRTGIEINVTPEDRKALEALIASRNTPAKVVWRAEIILVTSFTERLRLSSEPAAGLVEHGRQCRIVAQCIVVDQVLVAERDAEDALAQQVGNRVADGGSDAQIREAGSQAAAEARGPVGRSQQHDAAVRGDGATVESTHKFAAARPSQIKLALATLCRHRR